MKTIHYFNTKLSYPIALCGPSKCLESFLPDKNNYRDPGYQYFWSAAWQDFHALQQHGGHLVLLVDLQDTTWPNNLLIVITMNSQTYLYEIKIRWNIAAIEWKEKFYRGQYFSLCYFRNYYYFHSYQLNLVENLDRVFF